MVKQYQSRIYQWASVANTTAITKVIMSPLTEDENSLLNHYKKWIQLRNAVQQLRSGEITLINSSASSVLVFYVNQMKNPLPTWSYTI